jgi:hypothetical protein
MKYVNLIAFLLLALNSCDRKEFKSYKGVYNCNKAITTWQAGETTDHYVTTDHLIEVEKRNKTIILQGRSVHIDDIEPNKDHTFTIGDKDITIHFSEDYILYQEVDSAYGYGTRIQYVGRKE